MIWDSEAKARALRSLAAHLPEGLLERAVAAAEGIRDAEDKGQALASLAQRLAEPSRTELREWALSAVEVIMSYKRKAIGIMSLAEYLPVELLERMLTAAEGIGDPIVP